MSNWTDHLAYEQMDVGYYHDQMSGGELPNGVWAHGEFGDDMGPFIHYLLVMTLDPDRKVVYHCSRRMLQAGMGHG